MKKVLFILPALFLVLSCDNDDDDDQPAGKTKTQLITEGTWKFQAAGIDADKNGTWETNLANYIPDCAEDNTIKFETNGTGISDEGVSKCPNNPNQTTSFNWAFLTNETTLSITGNAVLGYGGQYKIVTLTDAKLSLSKDTTIPIIGAATVVADFIH